LLIEKYSFEEQAFLVWQFLCSIPVNMMTEFLPWLSSSISTDEQQDMHMCLYKIIPEEKLLRQVRIFLAVNLIYIYVCVCVCVCFWMDLRVGEKQADSNFC